MDGYELYGQNPNKKLKNTGKGRGMGTPAEVIGLLFLQCDGGLGPVAKKLDDRGHELLSHESDHDGGDGSDHDAYLL